jgi:hypothetical protein
MDQAYMLQKSGPPSSAKMFLDRQVVPGVINTAGGIEAVLERIATATKRAPGRSLAASFVVGAALGRLLGRRTS